MISIFKKLIMNDFGKFLISIILGLGLASLFKRSCKNKNCYKFKAPALEEIKENIYLYSDNCYKFSEEAIKCGTRLKTVEFA